MLRALVLLLLRRRPLDLAWRGRPFLSGLRGLFVPPVLLEAWLLVREVGVLAAAAALAAPGRQRAGIAITRPSRSPGC